MAMPGNDPQSRDIAADGMAETIVLMVKGGMDLDLACRIVGARSALYTELEALVMSKVKDMLKTFGTETDIPDLVRKPGISENFDPETVENGDLVAFGEGQKFYVLDVDHKPSYFWVTDRREDRSLTEGKGFEMYKKNATGIVEKAAKAIPNTYF